MCKCDPLCFDFNNGHLCKHIRHVHSLLQHTVRISEETDDMELVNSADIGSLSHLLSCLPLAEGQLHC